jgi:multisubunit Na+/H+ antiporter MnhE subunit
MTQPAVIHLLIALVGMFLSGYTTLGGLGVGLLAGFALLALFQRVLDCQDYVRRVVSVSAFGWRFLLQIVTSNVRIARAALRRDAGRIPGRFVRYSIEGLSHSEVLLLCWCISLTPGTAVADQDHGARELILHAFASGEPDEIRSHIDRDLKTRILMFTR